MLCECCATVYNTKSQLSNNKIIAILLCDPGAIQTHDLQNRNLTLYSLSYGAKCGCKSIKKLADS